MAGEHAKPKKELAYYLTLFKTKGHTTFRAYLSGSATGFQTDRDANMNGVEIDELKVFRIDRLDGMLTKVSEEF